MFKAAADAPLWVYLDLIVITPECGKKIPLSSNFANDHTKRTKKQMGDSLIADTSKLSYKDIGKNVKDFKLNHTKRTKKQQGMTC